MELIKQIEKKYLRETAKTDFSAGDTVTVNYRIQEGGKTRIQKYTGVVIQRRNGKGMDATFTVRKASANGIFVERIFALNSPLIETINVETRGRVRRARIYYLRERTGKSARIRELKTLGREAADIAAAAQSSAVSKERVVPVEQDAPVVAEEKVPASLVETAATTKIPAVEETEAPQAQASDETAAQDEKKAE